MALRYRELQSEATATQYGPDAASGGALIELDSDDEERQGLSDLLPTFPRRLNTFRIPPVLDSNGFVECAGFSP